LARHAYPGALCDGGPGPFGSYSSIPIWTRSPSTSQKKKPQACQCHHTSSPQQFGLRAHPEEFAAGRPLPQSLAIPAGRGTCSESPAKSAAGAVGAGLGGFGGPSPDGSAAHGIHSKRKVRVLDSIQVCVAGGLDAGRDYLFAPTRILVIRLE
jgi:hypothetical protein